MIRYLMWYYFLLYVLQLFRYQILKNQKENQGLVVRYTFA